MKIIIKGHGHMSLTSSSTIKPKSTKIHSSTSGQHFYNIKPDCALFYIPQRKGAEPGQSDKQQHAIGLKMRD